jgi:hypothetical protein
MLSSPFSATAYRYAPPDLFLLSLSLFHSGSASHWQLLHDLHRPNPLLLPSLPETLRRPCSSAALGFLRRVPLDFLSQLQDAQARQAAL